MLRQLMIYYIKVYSLPRSQAMRFDSKHQSHCLSCIFSQKIQFAFVDCSSICKQCLCIYKGSNTHGIANLPCVFCLLGCNPNPCEHHGTVMAAHSCGVLKEHFAKMRSLHRHEAEQRVWAAPNKLLQGKGLCVYKDIACRYNVIDETKIVSSQTVIWLCRFPKHSNIEVLTGAESGKIACLVSIQELLTV